MRIESKSIGDLTPNETQTWKAFSALPGLDSPFLHFEYAEAMTAFRPQVEVAVLSEGDDVVGFLPYERHGQHIARPLGVKLADIQAVVADSPLSLEPKTLLKELNLQQMHFDHLVTDQKLAAHRYHSEPSPFIDISKGFQSYLQEQKAHGHRSLRETLRKERKLRREIGKVEFRWHDHDELAFELMVQWKTAQRKATGTANILDFPWVRDFLKSLLNRETDGVQGALSTLRVNDEIVAVHLGIHTESTLHYWFPTYNIEYAHYSPGLILLLEMAKHAAEKGITKIDLGKGDDPYKWSFANGSIDVATVAIDCFPARRIIRQAGFHMKHWAKRLRIVKALKSPTRLIRNWHNQSTMKTS